MKLTFVERFAILSLFPQQANIVSLQRMQEARAVLLPTDEEKALLNWVEQKDGGITWSAEKDFPTEIKLGETVTDLVKSELKRLNDENQLELKHVSLWEKFVEAPAKAPKDSQVLTKTESQSSLVSS